MPDNESGAPAPTKVQVVNDNPIAVANYRGVTIVGLDIPFMDLVGLLVKLAIAAIPAALIVTVVGAIAMAILGAIFRHP